MSGLADPAPVAAMFWMDEELGSDLYLDGVITVVDSKFGLDQIRAKKPDSSLINEAVKQVALADVIVLNKIDLVPVRGWVGFKSKTLQLYLLTGSR